MAKCWWTSMSDLMVTLLTSGLGCRVYSHTCWRRATGRSRLSRQSKNLIASWRTKSSWDTLCTMILVQCNSTLMSRIKKVAWETLQSFRSTETNLARHDLLKTWLPTFWRKPFSKDSIAPSSTHAHPWPSTDFRNKNGKTMSSKRSTATLRSRQNTMSIKSAKWAASSAIPSQQNPNPSTTTPHHPKSSTKKPKNGSESKNPLKPSHRTSSGEPARHFL